MGRIDELRAILRQQVRQNNEQLWRCVQQMVSDYEQEASRLREENSRQRILSAVWTPHVCLNRAVLEDHHNKVKLGSVVMFGRWSPGEPPGGDALLRRTTQNNTEEEESAVEMWTLEDLTAMLSQPIPGCNDPVLGCMKRPVSDLQAGVSHLQDENSWQRKRLTAAWSPQVRLDRAEVLQHPAFREASSRHRAQTEPSAPLVQVKQEQEEQWISPEGAGHEELPQDPSWARPVKREEGDEPAPPSPPPQPEVAPPTRDPEPHVKQEPQSPAGGQEQQEVPGLHVRKEEEEEEGGETGAGSVQDSKPGLGPAKFIERVYPCPLCGLECVSKAHLRTHMRVHTGERPYSCPDCRKTYTTKGALNRHVRSFHHGDRPFRCQFCMFSFTFKSGLERHLRVHTGERPYTCSFCGLGFTQSGNLATHINVHHRVSSLKYKMKA